MLTRLINHEKVNTVDEKNTGLNIFMFYFKLKCFEYCVTFDNKWPCLCFEKKFEKYDKKDNLYKWQFLSDLMIICVATCLGKSHVLNAMRRSFKFAPFLFFYFFSVSQVGAALMADTAGHKPREPT